MRKLRKYIYFIALVAGLLYTDGMGAYAQMSMRMGKKIPDVERFINQQFRAKQLPPFSFVLDGVPSTQLMKTWKFTKSKKVAREADDEVCYTCTYAHPSNGLKVICDVIGYPSYNCVEWVLHFKNEGFVNSPVIEQVKVVDAGLKYQSEGDFKLHYAEGNHVSKSDFQPHSDLLKADEAKVMMTEGGRSSEGDYMPFFNIESPMKQGVFFSIGWSGDWKAELCRKADGNVTMSAGMKHMKLYLRPQEEIRTPSISLMFWQGADRMMGHNKFRRLVLAHKTRKIDGKFAEYPLSSGFNYRDPTPCTEYSCFTAAYGIAMVKRYVQFGLTPQVFWLDAGWHTGAGDYEEGKSWANTVGNWTVDSVRFPDGLKPIADEIHKHGAKFMVWFEPERVIRGTQWATEHPEWMLDIPEHDKDTYLLFDLGNPDACKWVSKYIGDMLEENGIDYYRQDFNMSPTPYWQANDEPGREGMKEIRHIEGLYQFWDYLLQRFPKLLIDNCASGGKRLDWETISRSAPLWRSDYYHFDDPDGYQCHTYGLNFFLPLHGTGSLQTDPYSFRSSMSSALIFNWKITDKNANVYEMRRCLDEYKVVRPYYYEDYYPLTGVDSLTNNNRWLAYQMHRDSDGSGLVVAFRRAECNDSTINVELKGLRKGAQYAVHELPYDTKKPVAYMQQGQSLHLIIRQKHSSLLLKYELVTNITETK